jgi:APA family basic amino acid/polyamine antiporter
VPRRRRRREQGLERVLGSPALFATAYGNVGSSIYYALGVTAAFALGLTPLIFVVAGVIYIATSLTYTEGTVRYPEAGGTRSTSS